MKGNGLLVERKDLQGQEEAKKKQAQGRKAIAFLGNRHDEIHDCGLRLGLSGNSA